MCDLENIYVKKYYGHNPFETKQHVFSYFSDHGRLVENISYSYNLSKDDIKKHMYTLSCDSIKKEYTILDVINDKQFFIKNWDNGLPDCSGKLISMASIKHCQKKCKSFDCSCHLSTNVKELEELGYVNVQGEIEKKIEFFKTNGFINH